MKRIIFLIAAAILFSGQYLFCQNYSLVERTDLRRYDNGKYTGLVSREVRSFIVAKTDSSDRNEKIYDGNFYVLEKTKRNTMNVKRPLNTAIPSSFKILSDGDMIMLEDNGYPSFRSFPSFTDKKISIGDSWNTNALRSCDPLNKNVFTVMPIYVQYTYLKDDVFYGEEVYVVQAKWATRYKAGDNEFDYDPDLLKASGSHTATMNISKKTKNALVVRDSVDETFFYADGKQITFRGTISLFTEYPPKINGSEIIKKLSAQKDIALSKTDAGIMLTLSDLKFKSDSAELLPGQTQLLDSIAQVLKPLEKTQFLIEGHTASTGNEKGELELSLERAYSIAWELSRRGVNEEMIICKGSGSHKPAADNSTPEGRAKNRRVEITILE